MTTALAGLRVLDVSTLFAGPLAATMLGDFGADVIKVEHPQGRPGPQPRPSKDGVGLWWKMLGRNKRGITLYLGSPEGQEVFRRLVATADVVIENFRPGTLERWGLGYDGAVRGSTRGLVLARVTGFGQFGPYSQPPRLRHPRRGDERLRRDHRRAGRPADPAAVRPGRRHLGPRRRVRDHDRPARPGTHRPGAGRRPRDHRADPHAARARSRTVYDQLGQIQPRTGNRSANNAPRNTYRTRGRPLGRRLHQRAVASPSGSCTSSAARSSSTSRGSPPAPSAPSTPTSSTRPSAPGSPSATGTRWSRAFEEAQAAVAPIYDVRDVLADPQFAALGSLVRVPDPDLGPVRMQNVLFRLSDTPGEIRSAGPSIGQHTEEVLGELGIDAAELAELRRKGAV